MSALPATLRRGGHDAHDNGGPTADPHCPDGEPAAGRPSHRRSHGGRCRAVVRGDAGPGLRQHPVVTGPAHRGHARRGGRGVRVGGDPAHLADARHPARAARGRRPVDDRAPRCPRPARGGGPPAVPRALREGRRPGGRRPRRGPGGRPGDDPGRVRGRPRGRGHPQRRAARLPPALVRQPEGRHLRGAAARQGADLRPARRVRPARPSSSTDPRPWPRSPSASCAATPRSAPTTSRGGRTSPWPMPVPASRRPRGWCSDRSGAATCT